LASLLLSLPFIQRQLTIRTFAGHSAPITALAALRDGRVITASRDRTLRVWNILERVGERHSLDGHSGPVTALTVLPDGRVVSGSADCTLRVWDPALGGTPTVLEGHKAPVTAVVALPDGRVVSGSEDCTLRIWDLAGNGISKVLEGHTAKVTTVAVLPDGRVISGSDDCTLRVWNEEKEVGAQPSFIADAAVLCLSVSDPLVVAGCADGAIHFLSFPVASHFSVLVTSNREGANRQRRRWSIWRAYFQRSFVSCAEFVGNFQGHFRG
jgi:WD40 repeat protein